MSESNMTSDIEYFIYGIEYKWKLTIGDQLFISFTKAPNIFWRTMQRIILGFKWERLESKHE